MARGEITTLLKYPRLPCRKRQCLHCQVRNWAAQFTPEASGRGSIGTSLLVICITSGSK